MPDWFSASSLSGASSQGSSSSHFSLQNAGMAYKQVHCAHCQGFYYISHLQVNFPSSHEQHEISAVLWNESPYFSLYDFCCDCEIPKRPWVSSLQLGTHSLPATSVIPSLSQDPVELLEHSHSMTMSTNEANVASVISLLLKSHTCVDWVSHLLPPESGLFSSEVDRSWSQLLWGLSK